MTRQLNFGFIFLGIFSCSDPQLQITDAMSVSELDSSTIDALAELDATTAPQLNIACGTDTCDPTTELCLACDHGDNRDVHCVEKQGVEPYEQARLVAEAHGCNQFQSLFIECDDSADCAPGTVCRFILGETGYSMCLSNQEDTDGACTTDSQCSGDTPVCSTIDTLGYFDPYEELLGWLPKECQ